MRVLINEYLKTIIVIAASILGITIFIDIIFSSTMEEKTFPENYLEIGMHRNIDVPDIIFNVFEEEITIDPETIFEEETEFNLLDEKYVQAQLSDGTDLSSFVVISGMPENIYEPDTYEITYYLKFEGSTDNTATQLIIGDGEKREPGLYDEDWNQISELTKEQVETEYTATNFPAKANIDFQNASYVILPKDISSIGSYIFANCTNLKYVYIPKDITSIGENACLNIPIVIYSGEAEGEPWGAIEIK